MAETDPIFPGEQRTSASGCGFFFVFLVGAAAVFIAFKREVGTPSIWLELGAGTMLFVVLYWVERRLVRNETERLMETFTGNIGQLEEMAATLQRADTVDYSESGPVEIASKWLYAMRHGHFETAWNLSDPSWRLCRAQAWLWNNPRTTAQYGDRDRIAQALASSDAHHPLWLPFIETEANQFRQEWRDVDPDTWGVASRRRPTGRDHELVIFTPLGPRGRGYQVHAPALLPRTVQLLMRRTEPGWIMASHISMAPPTPGWPPSWWALSDPALENLDQERPES